MPRTLAHLRPVMVAALFVAVVAGCGRSDRSAASDSTFVTTMAALRRVGRDSLLDSAAKDTMRRRILSASGYSVARLEARARALGDDPKRALAVWRSIDAHTRPAQQRGRPAPGARPPAR